MTRERPAADETQHVVEVGTKLLMTWIFPGHLNVTFSQRKAVIPPNYCHVTQLSAARAFIHPPND